MSQSLSRIILHLVFSTKERRPLLDESIRPRMHAYLATVCRDCGSEAYRIGGVADHVHIACNLPRILAPSQLVEKLKKASSKWIKDLGKRYSKVYWQGGYGAISVSPSRLDDLIAYIENQADHHRTVTFQDEYRSFLRRHGIDFDERYVWD